MSAPRAAGGQIQGKRRRQEDAFHVDCYEQGDVLAIVADGLGGHPAGDVASREAVREFAVQFSRRRDEGQKTPRQWMQESTMAAHEHLLEMTRVNRNLREMATTLIALYVRKSEFWAVSVGDSYLLLQRGDRLVRLNELHSEGGGVTSCVGYNLSRVDIADTLAVLQGDRFLLASDGIVALDDAEVSAFLKEATDAEAAVKGMLAAVEHIALPNQDNATAVVVLA